MALDRVIVKPGLYDGTRWTVLGPTHPGPRRGGMRARVKCRCACGRVEKAVFIEDLRDGRTKGCPSVECRTTFAAAQQALAAVDHVIERELDELRAVAREAVLERLMKTMGGEPHA